MVTQNINATSRCLRPQPTSLRPLCLCMHSDEHAAAHMQRCTHSSVHAAARRRMHSSAHTAACIQQSMHSTVHTQRGRLSSVHDMLHACTISLLELQLNSNTILKGHQPSPIMQSLLLYRPQYNNYTSTYFLVTWVSHINV